MISSSDISKQWRRFLHGFEGTHQTVYNSRNGIPSEATESVNIWDSKTFSVSVRSELLPFVHWAVESEENFHEFLENLIPEFVKVQDAWPKESGSPARLESLISQLINLGEIEDRRRIVINHRIYQMAFQLCQESTRRFIMFVDSAMEKRNDKNGPEEPDRSIQPRKDKTGGNKSLKRKHPGSGKQSGRRCISSRGMKSFVTRWYNQKPAVVFLTRAVKKGKASPKGPMGFNRFDHSDIIKLCHIGGDNEASDRVIRYLLGYDKKKEKKLVDSGIHVEEEASESGINVEEEAEVDRVMEIMEELRHPSEDSDLENIRALIEENEWIDKHHVNNSFVGKTPIIMALLPRLPFLTVLRWLPSILVNGAVEGENNSEVITQKLMDRLLNAENLKEGVSPDEILMCWQIYDKGNGKIRRSNRSLKAANVPKKLRYEANKVVLEALNSLYHDSFKTLSPTNKKLLICTEVLQSDFMEKEIVRINPLVVADVIASLYLRALRTESEPILVAFSGPRSEIVPLKVIKEDKLDDVKAAIKTIPKAPNGKLDMLFKFAQRTNERVDVFIIILKCKSARRLKDFHTAFQYYKKKTNKDAKVIFVLPLQPKDFEHPEGMDRVISFLGYDRFTAELIWRVAKGDLL